MRSVLQDWVMELPLREQGVLVLALRGPDGVAKEHAAKNMIRALRGCVMVTGGTGQPLVPGEYVVGDSFMTMAYFAANSDVWDTVCRNFFREWDSANVHFLFHIIHAAAILGFRYPDTKVAQRWHDLYVRCCRKCHCNPETPNEIMTRLRGGPKLDDPE